jgi:hypothetical protein
MYKPYKPGHDSDELAQHTESPEATGKYHCFLCGNNTDFIGYDAHGCPGQGCDVCPEGTPLDECDHEVELRQVFRVPFDGKEWGDPDYDAFEGGGDDAQIDAYTRIECGRCHKTVWEEGGWGVGDEVGQSHVPGEAGQRTETGDRMTASTIRWSDVSTHDTSLIAQIVARVGLEFPHLLGENGAAWDNGEDRITLTMDLTAVHLNTPLDLQALLEADQFDFAHDVAGIQRHINRNTGKLGGCFLPRSAVPQ